MAAHSRNCPPFSVRRRKTNQHGQINRWRKQISATTNFSGSFNDIRVSQVSDDLARWNTVATNAGPSFEWMDPEPAHRPSRFYRALIQP